MAVPDSDLSIIYSICCVSFIQYVFHLFDAYLKVYTVASIDQE